MAIKPKIDPPEAFWFASAVFMGLGFGLINLAYGFIAIGLVCLLGWLASIIVPLIRVILRGGRK